MKRYSDIMKEMFHHGYVTLEQSKSDKYWVTATVTKPVWSIVKGLRQVLLTNNLTE